MNHCPGEDELRLLLSGGLDGPALEAMTAHLEVCERCGGLLQRITDADLEDLTLPPLPPPARFRVLDGSPLGEGGLGRVFLAYDEELHRTVALKQLRPQYADLEGHRTRFVREAEITGQLQHPGVIPVYALGRHPDGTPFYMMRPICGEASGTTLADSIAAFHATGASDTTDGRALALRELLARFRGVCDAVAYAHSQGVVHGDLKPANVLVGAFGETLVGDWGLARRVTRAVGDPSFSMGRPACTPEYTSPEQAAGRSGEIGPASDIYSLGAILYAILTGRSPFVGREKDAVLEAVARGEFSRPGLVKRSTPRALEAVCLKAMALDPRDRYESASGLSLEVARWLADEAVLAFREPLAMRLARWGRHHQPAVVALIATVLLASVATALLGLLARSERRAEASFTLARGAVYDLMDRVAEYRLPSLPQSEELRRDIATLVIRESDRLIAERPEDPALLRSAAAVDRQAANLCRLSRDIDRSLEQYRKSEDCWRRVQALQPGRAGDLAQLAATISDEGEALRISGRVVEALARQQDALSLVEPIRSSPSGTPFPMLDAVLQVNLGTTLQDLGRYEQGLEAFRRAGERIGRLPQTGDRGVEVLTASALVGQGACLQKLARPSDAEAAFGQAIERLEPRESDPTFSRDAAFFVALALNARGSLRASQAGREAEAEADFQAARGRLDRLDLNFPGQPDYRMQRAATAEGLGNLRLAQKRNHEAGEELRAALAILEGLLGPAKPRRPGDAPVLRQAAAVHMALVHHAAASGRPELRAALVEDAVVLQGEAARHAPDSPEDRELLEKYRAEQQGGTPAKAR